MYPTSNSSSSPSHDGDRTTTSLPRYRSSAVNGQNRHHHHHHLDFAAVGPTSTTHFFPRPGEQLQRTSALRINEFATAFKRANDASPPPPPPPPSTSSSNNNPTTTTTTASPSLLRHSSSPAGFLNGLMVSPSNDGRVSGLSSQLSFTGSRDSLPSSQFPAETSFIFSASSSSHNKQPKLITSQVNGLHILDSECQLQFGLSETALEAAAMEKLMDIPHDSVPCKIRAKRGCATHPRSIAERERRTRISGKLKKLQDLVPNMDKQTSYADMLDLAVQHIKGLQADIQNLNKALETCTCGLKPTSSLRKS